MLAVVCVMNLLARGFMETHAIFMLSLEQEFEWSRTEVSGIYSIAMLTFGLTGPAVGFLLDRLGPPKVYTLGLLLILPVSVFPRFRIRYGFSASARD